MNTTSSAMKNCNGWLIPCDSVIPKFPKGLVLQHLSESLGKREPYSRGRQSCEQGWVQAQSADTPAHAARACSTPTTHISCASGGKPVPLACRRDCCFSLSGEPLSKSGSHVNHCIFQSANVPGVEASHKANSKPSKTHLQQICKLHFKARQEQRKWIGWICPRTYVTQPLAALSQLIELCFPKNDEPSPGQC